MKKPLLFGMLVLIGCSMLSAQVKQTESFEKMLSHKEAVADINYLIDLLNDTHPDPFSGIGGRVEFQLQAKKMLAAVPADGNSQTDLYKLMKPFICNLKDGHTYILSPANTANKREKGYLPVRFKVADDAIFVIEALQPYEYLLGSQFLGAAGYSSDELRVIIGNIFPCENEFSASQRVTRYLQSRRSVYMIKEDIEDEVSIDFLKPNGESLNVTLPYSDITDAKWINARWSGTEWEKDKNHPPPFYHRIWPERNAAYDMLYQLWRLGAEVVGVSPAQAANSFVDGSPYILPFSKLEGGLSRTAVIYPRAPEKGRAFIPDYPMKWKDFKDFNFDLKSEVLFILSNIERSIVASGIEN